MQVFLAAIRCGRRGWVLISLFMIAALLATYGLVEILTQKSVTLYIGDQVRHIRTHADTAGAALDEAGILIDPEDIVWPDPSTPLHDGDTITVQKAHVVAVDVDGSVRRVRTQAAHPFDVLVSQQIPLTPHDVIRVDGQTFSPEALERRDWQTPFKTIFVRHSVAITAIDIVIDPVIASGIAREQTRVFYTTQTDVGRALDEAGFVLYLADRVTPDLSTPVSEGLVIRIERALALTVIVDGHTLTTRSVGPTVGDALAALEIAPLGLDVTIPPEDTPLEPGMTIRVVRVTEGLVVARTDIPFSTIMRPDRQLPRGEQRVLQTGVPGERERHFRVRYEDGIETERQIVSEKVIREPVPRVVAYGVKRGVER